MRWMVNGHYIIEIIFVTFLISVLLVPIAKKLATYIGALDIPNERKVHKVPIPRLGGLAIYGAFLVGYILYGEVTTQMLSILIGSFIIFLIGVFDDIKPIKAKYKFIVQIIAALIVVIYGQIYFNEITFLGLNLRFNLLVSYILSLIMLGSTLGFLFHNFPPAKIFMGDSGSLFLGFMISVIALVSFKVATLTSLVIPIVILAIPIFDTVLAIFRRLLKGENIGTPDKEHFHHQLLKLKFSPRVSILIIYSISIIFSVISILYVIGKVKEAIIIYLFLMIMLLFIILKTDILYQHKSKDNK